jgi:tetratricopeptide (TPR) repeat protein
VSETIPLGPFDLAQPIGRGGTGTVWSARHRALGRTVAVKVVDLESDEDVSRLEHEVRAVAGLDHPNVIRVWDQGRVDLAAVRASHGQLGPESAWFAMELADAGRIAGPLRWSEVRAHLGQLLGALAHAHSRGVLPRDIKPANVLFARDEHGGRTLKLTDFGLVFVLDGPPGVHGGTPHWMAPEQFAGDLAAQGPWTDLYSVGCLAYALLVGRPPFRGGKASSASHVQRLHDAHLYEPFPALPDRVAVPEGFDAWLGGLVAKDPTHRWTHAADAAVALASLPDAEDADPPTADDLSDEGPTLVRTGRESGERAMATLIGARLRSGGPGLAAPCPEDWRLPPRTDDVLRGIGLGLFGLRPIPLVGREAEQDAAWTALRAVHADGRTRLVLFEGAAGLGKSRLAEWLAHTAGEVGAARILRAGHSAEQSLRDGLPGLVARHYRVRPDRTFAEVKADVARALVREGERDPDDEAEQIALLLRPDHGDGQTADQRFGVVERLLTRLAADRPVLVWLDDLHHGPESLALVRRLLRGFGRALFVATVQEEALDERPAVRQAVRELVASAGERGTHRVLGPLPAERRGDLVRGLLGLTDEIAAVVEARSEGNPLFAVQLVGEWVQRGRLIATDRGFALAPDERPTLPDSIAQLWERRLAALGRPEWHAALEIAAVLGREVDRREWAEAARREGIEVGDDLVGRLVDQRLIRVDPDARDRLTFAHALLRESLAAAPRAARWHRVVRARGGPDADERAGRHLLAAGDLDGAAPLLLMAVHDRTRAGEAPAGLELADALDRALARRPLTDPIRAELAVLRAQALRVLGRLGEARDLIGPYADLAARMPPRARAHVLREHALGWLHAAGASDELYAWLAQAREAAVTAGERVLAADIDVEEGRALEYHGRVRDAGALYARALAVYQRERNARGQADAQVGLASVANKEGRHDEASAHVEEALARLIELRSTWRILFARLLVGEIARFRGRLDEAEAVYREAIQRYERLSGRGQTALPRTNLALVLLEAGRYDEAAATLAEARVDASAAGHTNLERMVDVIAAWAAAGRGDAGGVDRGLEVGEALLAERVVDPDLARAVEAVGRLVTDPRRRKWATKLAARMQAALAR